MHEAQITTDDEWSANIRKTIRERRPGNTDEGIKLLALSCAFWGTENYRLAATSVERSVRLVDAPSSATNPEAFINLNVRIQ